MSLQGLNGIVLQLNTSKGGVPKRPIPEADVTPNGIVGDAWRHPQFHGGPRKAILLITAEGIDDLVTQGFPIFYGALGENITTRGLERRSLRIGQRYRAGEVTHRTVPDTLALWHPQCIRRRHSGGYPYDWQGQGGDPASPQWGLSGFYASVVRPGKMRAGDTISLVDQSD